MNDMNQKALAPAMYESITDEVSDILCDIAEMGLDAIMDDAFLREIPFLSTAVSLYRIGTSIRDRQYVKKLSAFILALNNGIVNDVQRKHYKAKVVDNPKRRNRELEYILILIDRYLHSDKAQNLAKLYLCYLDERISWHDFSKFAEVLDRLMPGDYTELCTGIWENVNDTDVSDNLLRLVSLGLVVSHNQGAKVDNTPGTLVFPDMTVKDYEITKFGRIFLECLS